MPVTRRSTGGSRARAGPAKGQSTISFSNRVTKSGPKDTKKAVAGSGITKVAEPALETAASEDVESAVDDDADVDVDADADSQAEVERQEHVREKSEAELRAEQVGDAQIRKYWRGVEAQRKAPRVHQEDLDLSEKMLRYFDVSSQYGPCIGVSRMKRWQRAERLGLHPPIEVLAVLLREEEKRTEGIEITQMDKILNSIAGGP